MKVYYLFSIFLLNFSVIFFVQPTFAEITTIIADADIMEKNTPKKTLNLKGNVNVLFQQQHLLCDEATVYENTSTIIAQGNVVLQSARTTLRGDRIEFNYDTNTGKIFNGVVTSGQVLIQSDVIEKVGEDEYEANDAYYTACITCPPSWGFTSTNIKAEIGGYAYISRPWLYLLEFPVLPLPYLVVPLNSKRQTGLLGFNNNGGTAIEVPFFWAIDRSHDATFTLVNYEKRGQQILGNYRYVISEESSGEINTSFLPKDRTVENHSRWFFQYQHLYVLPDNYTQRTEINLASDNQYPVDFPKQLPFTGQAALNNNISLTKKYENSILSLDSSYYISLLEKDFSNTDSVHRMPEINYNIMDELVSEDLNLYFNLDVQYLNITSNGSAFRHTGYGTGECDTNSLSDVCFYNDDYSKQFIYGQPGSITALPLSYGDIIRTGQRLDVMPNIHAPFWLGNILDVDPGFSMRYTQYSLGVESDPSQSYNSFPSRFYTQFDVSTKSYITRVFDWSEDTKIKHSIIPEINLKYIPGVHQTNHSFFGTQKPIRYFSEQQPIQDFDADWRNGGRGIQFDNNDRIIGKQLVDFGISNKIVSRNKNKSSGLGASNSPYQQNVLFQVSQVFDISEAQRGQDARPWQNIRSYLSFVSGPFSQSLVADYYPYHATTFWSASSQYTFLGNNSLGLTYNKNYLIHQDPPVNDNTRSEVLTASTGLNLNLIHFYGSFDYVLSAKTSNSRFPRWMVMTDIIPPGSCWSVRAGIERYLGPEEKYVNNFIFNMEFKFSE
jgi:LPS-assembly protein